MIWYVIYIHSYPPLTIRREFHTILTLQYYKDIHMSKFFRISKQSIYLTSSLNRVPQEVKRLNKAYNWQSTQQANFAPHYTCHSMLNTALFDTANKLPPIEIFWGYIKLLAAEEKSTDAAEVRAITGIISTQNLIYYLAHEMPKLYRHTGFVPLFENASKLVSLHQLVLNDNILKLLMIDTENDNQEMCQTKTLCLEMVDGIDFTDRSVLRNL